MLEAEIFSEEPYKVNVTAANAAMKTLSTLFFFFFFPPIRPLNGNVL